MQVDDAVEGRSHRRRPGAVPGPGAEARPGWTGFASGLTVCLVLALAVAITAFLAARRSDVPTGAAAGARRPAPTLLPSPASTGPSPSGSVGAPASPSASGASSRPPARPSPSRPARTGPAGAPATAAPRSTTPPAARTTPPPAPAPLPPLTVDAAADRPVRSPGELTGVTVTVRSPAGTDTGGAALTVTLPVGTAVDANAAPLSDGCTATSSRTVRCGLPARLPAGWSGSYRVGLVSTDAAAGARTGSAAVEGGTAGGTAAFTV